MKKEMSICSKCGNKSLPVEFVKGSFFIEVVLWLFLLLPGLIYSIWRLTTKALVCPKCKTPGMLPLDSPMGKKLDQDLQTS